MEHLIIYGVPALSAAVTGGIAFAAARHRMTAVLMSLAGFWAVIAAVVVLGLMQANFLDGIVWLLALVGIVAPAGMGILAGAVPGWVLGYRVPDPV